MLEMLHAILVKLPPAVVENQAQSWFLHLVVALANDTDKNVQSMVATVIKLLLGRISQKALHPILEYSLSWYRGERQHLWSAAAQVFYNIFKLFCVLTGILFFLCMEFFQGLMVTRQNLVY